MQISHHVNQREKIIEEPGIHIETKCVKPFDSNKKKRI